MTLPRRHNGDRATPDAGRLVYRLDMMTQDDVPDVSRVERRCFPNPWPASAYRRELQNPAQNFYVVLRQLASDASPRRDRAPAATVAADSASAVKALPRRSLLPIALGRRHESNGNEQVAVIGFAGMWLAFDEAHITTIGIDPGFRGEGLGELLLLSVVDEAVARRANWLTLEVRISNTSAQTLYRKYGFSVHGSRKRYYSDNNEDALIMWSRALSDPGFRADIEAHRGVLERRLGAKVDESELSPFPGPMTRSRTS